VVGVEVAAEGDPSTFQLIGGVRLEAEGVKL